MNKPLFNQSTIRGEVPFRSEFNGDFNRYFDVILKEQLLDREMWRLIERQFDLKWDSYDNGWRGEYWGKMMRGASLIYAQVKSEELYDVLTESVKNLLTKAEDNGRISAYNLDCEFNTWDIWARKYVMLGLEFYYDICKDEKLKAQIIALLERHADYIVERIGDGEGKKPISTTSKVWGAINSVSILQPFVILNKIVKKQSYSHFIDMLLATDSMENFNIFQCFRRSELYPYQYPVVKAYEMISCAEGMLDLYLETGRKEYLDTCVSFADKVLASDFTLIGGIGGYDENFDNSTKTQVIYSEIHKQETCVTVTLMKYLYFLYLATDEKKYVDAIERSFFNAYLGALNDKPYYGHLVRPLFYSYSPIFDNPRWDTIGGAKNISSYAGFGCCIAIGAAGLGIIPRLNLLGNSESVVINMFMKGKYSSDNAVINIESDYPRDGKVKLTLSKYAKNASLRVRYPYWAKGVELSINGKAAECVIDKGYLVISGVKEKDEITVDFCSPVTVTRSVEVNGKVKGLFAISKCALAYCVDSTRVPLEARYDIDGLDLAAGELTEWGLRVKFPNGELELEQYRNCGKNYYLKPNISVWLKTEEYKV